MLRVEVAVKMYALLNPMFFNLGTIDIRPLVFHDGDEPKSGNGRNSVGE